MAAIAGFAVSAAPVRAMTIASGDVRAGAPIAARYVYGQCGGQNVSPALHWSGTPAAATALALTVIDLDVKPAFFAHWIVLGLPPRTRGVARGIRALPGGARTVVNDFGDAAYDGPCPPAGSGAHRYVFTIWALRATPALFPNRNARDVAAALRRASVAHASLEATEQR